MTNKEVLVMTQQNNNSFMTFSGQPGCACTKNNPSSHAVNIVMPRPYEQGALSDNARLTTYVVCLTSVAYIVNIHGAHSYWKQGALGAAGVRDGLQLGRRVRRTAGGGILCRHAHSLLLYKDTMDGPLRTTGSLYSSLSLSLSLSSAVLDPRVGRELLAATAVNLQLSSCNVPRFRLVRVVMLSSHHIRGHFLVFSGSVPVMMSFSKLVF